MSKVAVLRTLSQTIRSYDRASARFSGNKISEAEFDLSFEQLRACLERSDIKALFADGYFQAKAANDNLKTNATVRRDYESVLDFESRLTASLLLSRRQVKPVLQKALVADMFPAENIDVADKLSQAHHKIKEIIKDSRHKNKKEKKIDKRYKISIVQFAIGLCHDQYFICAEFTYLQRNNGVFVDAACHEKLEIGVITYESQTII